MKNKINFYKDRVSLNVLAKDINNAKEIIDATEGNVIVGVLSKNFATTKDAVLEMNKWKDETENRISVGLGAGDPKQSYMVAEIVKEINPAHANQVFTGVGLTVNNYNNKETFINCLCSPSGKPGYVVISTGPLSSNEEKAVVPIKTAIQMIKDMGGDSIKFFPMKGLSTIEEYKIVAKACAENDFALEPTGGIDLDNFKEILKIALDAGVNKIIPHVYNSIIDENGNTNIDKTKILFNIIKELV
ncbi:2-dehydro-3-deoxyphosphooctonate aldolase [Mesoplasma florum]|uniref:2-dehydro-3-deoxy-phosphogluconate aldolase n=1 Tax=Mesoplasma florum TaxID=2151 RepID=UPI000D03CB1B|nr:KDGP aldolase [Mesoplasma florum]AVN58915.1 2-dehydro-3-deoxyphosphooctonate aldolase [Mesoplasma florum]AVN63674.1 2-dehydro-3-deoxyphosphooctonate aldolase [Mesoplasma florum]